MQDRQWRLPARQPRGGDDGCSGCGGGLMVARPIPLLIAVALAGSAVAGRRRLGKERAFLLLAAAGALGAHGFGAFEVGSLESLIRDIGPTLGGWTYLVVGVLAFLETAALIGLVAPGELTVVIGGVAAAQGGVDVVAIFFVAWACATAGDLTSYALGRRLGRPFLERHGPKLGISAAILGRVEQVFDRHGGKTILIGRFVGVVRALAPFLAGVSRMPLARFAAVDAIGSGLWAGAFTALGYVAAANLDTALDVVTKGKLALGALLVVAVIVVVVRRARASRRVVVETVPAPGSTGGET